ncbi:serine/threonine protein kinase [Streptomyces sp. NBC_00201]|uniref:serine/threonine-protein kinase n=1 Tax=unclassified Streptomyces TaxID=2593676 RepID=UPI002258D4E3|nr:MULTISPECIES: serine/threonine-protein kinase [unclassified Streptomyces]MCX5058221.1 serine/threonine protein kinase [Streptomyces sp. NBC_00452]MCX5244899.1 serine/threonine protein kinase [Streptomyces sp. NBC_00201]MCX5289369.1 serine/threonine protein kinase [Streptomyces sp. NBC_00183]
MSEEPGSERVVAGRYRLLSPLGEGGMGTVWRARDEVLHREVAVKEVRAPAGLPASDVERMYARLEREAWAAARVADRNVVTVYDVATEDGRPWIVMELVRGISLAELLDAEGPLPPQRAAHIGAEVLSALRAAHEAGVLHRDVKPANVLLSSDGRVVLTDFGIAMVEGSSALTMTGEVIGSPEFLAPERALGRTPGPESDLWSLGVLLYAAVEGNSPFRQATPLNTLRAIVDDELPPPLRAGPLAPVIEGLLRKDPAERLTADRAQQDLRIIGAGGTPRTEVLPTAPYAPTIAEYPGRGTPAPPPPYASAPTGPVPAPGTTATTAPPERNRRAAVVLVVGVLALALALGGLTYALLNRDNGDGSDNNGSNTRSGSGTSPTAAESKPGGGAASPTPSPSSSRTKTPQSVKVSLAGANTDYSGTCPPSNSEAPTFTATLTVGRLPATVTYRWVTENGSLSGNWKTVSFPADGDRSQQDRQFITTRDDSGTFQDVISVEVRDPVHATSNSVPFSLSCEKETPTDGTSSSPSTSESPSQ